jgi:hypothetical protein
LWPCITRASSPGRKIEDGILHAERIEHAFFQEVRVGLAAAIGERGTEQVEAIVGIERSRAWRKQQGIGLETGNLRVPGVGSEWIVRRRVGTRHFARQA